MLDIWIIVGFAIQVEYAPGEHKIYVDGLVNKISLYPSLSSGNTFEPKTSNLAGVGKITALEKLGEVGLGGGVRKSNVKVVVDIFQYGFKCLCLVEPVSIRSTKTDVGISFQCNDSLMKGALIVADVAVGGPVGVLIMADCPLRVVEPRSNGVHFSK